MKIWMPQAMPPEFMGRGLRFALIVGTILTAINQADVLASSAITPGALIKILLNYCVPYLVSTYVDLEALDRQQCEWNLKN